MWHYYHEFFNHLTRLNFEQTVLMVLVIVAFGFFCMRGFGSRSNY